MIRRLAPDDWQAYREIRLEALRLEPRAFLSTFAKEALLAAADWRTRLATASAFAAGTPLQGIAALLPDGCVVAVYVRAAARGKGHAQALMEAVRQEAEARGLSRLWLHVAKDNLPAQRLYDRLGYAFEAEDGTDFILSRAP